MSDSVQPQRRQPTRLLHPWDSPGKNTGVSCHFLLEKEMEKEMTKHTCMQIEELQTVLTSTLGYSQQNSQWFRNGLSCRNLHSLHLFICSLVCLSYELTFALATLCNQHGRAAVPFLRFLSCCSLPGIFI